MITGRFEPVNTRPAGWEIIPAEWYACWRRAVRYAFDPVPRRKRSESLRPAEWSALFEGRSGCGVTHSLSLIVAQE